MSSESVPLAETIDSIIKLMEHLKKTVGAMEDQNDRMFAQLQQVLAPKDKS